MGKPLVPPHWSLGRVAAVVASTAAPAGAQFAGGGERLAAVGETAGVQGVRLRAHLKG